MKVSKALSRVLQGLIRVSEVFSMGALIVDMTKEGLGACLVCLRTVGGYWRYVVIPTSRIEARVLCETQTLGPTELEECVVYVIL